MHVWCYGHFGLPVVVFPSAAGFAHEWDAQGMVEALADLINGGKIKLYCPESNISKTWTDKTSHPKLRVARHQAYEAFILKTLVPAIYSDCNSEGLPIMTTGCSMGGYYAATFALKYPHIFRRCVAMSGRYNLTGFTDGYSDTEVYLNDPLSFVPNLHGDYLEHVRQHTHVTLICGQGAYEEGCIEETIALGKVLDAKQIPNTTDIWGHDSKHDWVWWKRQALFHFSKAVG